MVCAPLALVYKPLEYTLYSLSKSYSCLHSNPPSVSPPQNPGQMLLASMPLGHPKTLLDPILQAHKNPRRAIESTYLSK